MDGEQPTSEDRSLLITFYHNIVYIPDPPIALRAEVGGDFAAAFVYSG